jgi:hypothetical protein
MRRPFTIATCALVLALAPAAAFAQDPAPAAAQPPATPKLAFTTDAGLLLIQIKPDQTALFEELITKLKAGVAKSTDATLKQQMSGFKVYKSAEPMAGNALYVVVVDPAVKGNEYELFALLQKVMTPDELRDPANQEFFKKAAAAFAAGYNKLNLSPVAGGQ